MVKHKDWKKSDDADKVEKEVEKSAEVLAEEARAKFSEQTAEAFRQKELKHREAFKDVKSVVNGPSQV